MSAEALYDDKPWLKWYAPGVPTDVMVPNVPLTRMLDISVDSFPRRPALIFLGNKITYAELGRSVDRLAWALGGLGVHKGDRVALMLPNCPQQVIAFYAVLRRGAIVVMHNPLYTVPELRTQLADSGARIVITFDRGYTKIMSAREGTDVEHVIVTSLADYLPAMKKRALNLPLKRAAAAKAELTAPLPGDATYLSFAELIERSQAYRYQVPVDPIRDIAVLQYTGGTTGKPKGAMLSHYNLVANACQTAAWDPAARTGREVGIAVLPLFHVFGLTMCLTTSISMGATSVLVPKFDVDLILAAVRRHSPTIFPGVPPIYQQIAASPKARKAGLDTVRVCISGAMQLRRQTVDEFAALTGGHVVQGYGMTETSPVTMANPLNGNARHISVGLPVPGTQARIVSERDPSVVMPPGQAGELVIRGPQVFRGYWKQPEETDEVLLPDGWFRTGDIATMSPDGFFTLIDRKRDIVIVDGFNVYPSEIEEVLNAHPSVADSAVIGVPDQAHGERVAAYVKLREDSRVQMSELIEYCAEQLTEYKVPAVIEIRDTLPHDMLGKVRRRILRDELTTPPPPLAVPQPGPTDRPAADTQPDLLALPDAAAPPDAAASPETAEQPEPTTQPMPAIQTDPLTSADPSADGVSDPPLGLIGEGADLDELAGVTDGTTDAQEPAETPADVQA